MPLPRPCFLPAASCCTAVHADVPSGSANKAAHSQTLQITTSDTSCSFEIPSASSAASASCFDDNVSLQTLPSIPSVPPLNLPASSHNTHPPSADYLCLSAFRPRRSAASALALSVTHSSLTLYAASEAEIAVYDLNDLRQIESLAAPSGAGSVKSVALSPDGSRVFTAHQDGRIRAWKRSGISGTHRLLATLPTTTDRLRRLPLPSSYVTVRRHKKRLWIEHADAVAALATSGGLLYSVSWDKTLKFWRSSNLQCLESKAAHEDAVNAVAVAADGTVYTGSADRKIRVWRRVPGKRRHSLVATLERHRSAVNALTLSGDGSVLYSGACDRSILVWEREDSAGYMEVAGALRGHGRAILCLACVGDLLFSGSSDRTVRIWRRGREGEGYSSLGVMEGHVRGVRSLAGIRVSAEWSDEDEYRVCSGSLDGEVRVWRIRVSNPRGSDSPHCATLIK